MSEKKGEIRGGGKKMTFFLRSLVVFTIVCPLSAIASLSYSAGSGAQDLHTRTLVALRGDDSAITVSFEIGCHWVWFVIYARCSSDNFPHGKAIAVVKLLDSNGETKFYSRDDSYGSFSHTSKFLPTNREWKLVNNPVFWNGTAVLELSRGPGCKSNLTFHFAEFVIHPTLAKCWDKEAGKFYGLVIITVATIIISALFVRLLLTAQS